MVCYFLFRGISLLVRAISIIFKQIVETAAEDIFSRSELLF